MSETTDSSWQGRIFYPMRGDLILSTLQRVIHPNPWWIGAMYLIFELGGTFLLAWWCGVLFPVQGMSKTQYLPLLQDYGNFLNFGFIIPLGIVLIFRFYHQLQQGMERLIEDRILSFSREEERDAFLWTLDYKINRPWYFWLAVGLAVLLNVWIAVMMKGTWNSFYPTATSQGVLYALPAAIWFRVFTCVNFTLVFFVLIRGVAVIRLMHLLFAQDLQLQPLHPDRCSGLLPLGRISSSLNLFLALVTLYITVLIVVDGIPLLHPLFLSVVVLFLGFACFLFLTPMLYSHHKMQEQRQRILRALNEEFQKHFLTLAESMEKKTELPYASIQRMELLEKLNQTAQKMPTWPVDMQSISRFFAVGVGPIGVALVKLFWTTPVPDKIKPALAPVVRRVLSKPSQPTQRMIPPKKTTDHPDHR